MSDAKEIFVCVLGEGVDVWRPVLAVHVHDNVYRIIDQLYDRDIEAWQFIPGEKVVCEMIDSSDGRIFAAVRKG